MQREVTKTLDWVYGHKTPRKRDTWVKVRKNMMRMR